MSSGNVLRNGSSSFTKINKPMSISTRNSHGSGQSGAKTIPSKRSNETRNNLPTTFESNEPQEGSGNVCEAEHGKNDIVWLPMNATTRNSQALKNYPFEHLPDDVSVIFRKSSKLSEDQSEKFGNMLLKHPKTSSEMPQNYYNVYFDSERKEGDRRHFNKYGETASAKPQRRHCDNRPKYPNVAESSLSHKLLNDLIVANFETGLRKYNKTPKQCCCKCPCNCHAQRELNKGGSVSSGSSSDDGVKRRNYVEQNISYAYANPRIKKSRSKEYFERQGKWYIVDDQYGHRSVMEDPYMLRERYGKVPCYLQKRKMEIWQRDLELKRKLEAERDAICRRINDDERVFIVKTLEDHWHALNKKLCSMPMFHCSQRTLDLRHDVDTKMKELETQLQLFQSSAPIFVSNDSENEIAK